MLRSIGDFCPRGTQLSHPGGTYIDPDKIVGMEADEDNNGRYVRIFMESGSITLRFHNRLAEHYKIMENLACNINEDKE